VKASIRGLFLDRDGTLMENKHSLSQPDGVVLPPGVRETCKRTPPPWVPRSGRRRLVPDQPLLAIRRRARLSALASAPAAHAGSLGRPCS